MYNELMALCTWIPVGLSQTFVALRCCAQKPENVTIQSKGAQYKDDRDAEVLPGWKYYRTKGLLYWAIISDLDADSQTVRRPGTYRKRLASNCFHFDSNPKSVPLRYVICMC